jgi:hypothetical protein
MPMARRFGGAESVGELLLLRCIMAVRLQESLDQAAPAIPGLASVRADQVVAAAPRSPAGLSHLGRPRRQQDLKAAVASWPWPASRRTGWLS